MKSELQTPSDFVLQRVEISADRFQGLVDITNSVIEFNVFESIEDIFCYVVYDICHNVYVMYDM